MFFQEHLGRIAARAVAGIVAVAALASCGGGTYQVTAFVPARILTFGDESNQLVGAQGLKYSVNTLSPFTHLVDCSLGPLWDQALATSYGLVYANCNIEAVVSPGAFDMSTLNATVDDVVAQVNAFQSGDTFNGNDLVTIWVGAHDVLNDYQANGTGDEPTLISDMQGAGQGASDQVGPARRSYRFAERRQRPDQDQDLSLQRRVSFAGGEAAGQDHQHRGPEEGDSDGGDLEGDQDHRRGENDHRHESRPACAESEVAFGER